MAAAVARKTRVAAFGIALCFLAALFFVEAKTIWEFVGGHSAFSITSSKALAVERSQLHSTGSALAQFGEDNLLLHSSIEVLSVACFFAYFLLGIAPKSQALRACHPGCHPSSHFERPPPSH
jgi:hypothetical protein